MEQHHHGPGSVAVGHRTLDSTWCGTRDPRHVGSVILQTDVAREQRT